MLLSASITRLLRLFGLFDRLGNDLRKGTEPVGLLDELAALDLKDLDPAAALVIGRGDLQGRYQPAEAEVLDRLEALLDLFAGRLLAAIRLDRVAGRLGVKSGPQYATVVHNRVV